MGIILKYQVSFSGKYSLEVSNDPFSGKYLIDAEIKVQMKRGAGGTFFEIKLLNLPYDEVQKLTDAQKDASDTQMLEATIKLGYFDGAYEEVVSGVVKEVKGKFEGEDYLTTIKGEETATYWLKNTEVNANFDDNPEISTAVERLLQQAELSNKGISTSPNLNNVNGTLENRTIREEKLIKALDELASYADSDLMVFDGGVWVGQPIVNDLIPAPPGAPPVPSVLFDYDSNLLTLDAFVKSIPEEAEISRPEPLTATQAWGFTFKCIGLPELKPAQVVKAIFDEFSTTDTTVYRIQEITHEWSYKKGFSTSGEALRVSDDARSTAGENGTANADTVAYRISRLHRNHRRNNPIIEIGKVQAHDRTTGYTDLFYGQNAPRTESQPSIRADVNDNPDKRFLAKPRIASFAWHKCGHVVPVYPGMKAALSHNHGLTNDVLINGFLWSEDPAYEQPAYQDGDWWICLPVDFDASQPPSDSTKAVNDLVTNTGHRVIELKGLKITVGNSKLQHVGERPTPTGDDEFFIEHQSGTEIKIDSSGNVSIKAGTITLEGDVVIQGTLDVQ